MKGFVCGVCKFISINGNAPEKCPVCGAPKTAFEEKEDAVKQAKDEMTLTEKHTPVIIINKKCGLIKNGCQDINVKIGEITHPMLPEHFIMHIDFYIDNGFVARVQLTPNVNPAAAIHIREEHGKISVVELCNLHGAWIQEVNL